MYLVLFAFTSRLVSLLLVDTNKGSLFFLTVCMLPNNVLMSAT